MKYIAETAGGEEGYFIEWLEKDPDSSLDWTKTTVPKNWVKPDTQVERIMAKFSNDITYSVLRQRDSVKV